MFILDNEPNRLRLITMFTGEVTYIDERGEPKGPGQPRGCTVN
jgi:hypothetical protein